MSTFLNIHKIQRQKLASDCCVFVICYTFRLLVLSSSKNEQIRHINIFFRQNMPYSKSEKFKKSQKYSVWKALSTSKYSINIRRKSADKRWSIKQNSWILLQKNIMFFITKYANACLYLKIIRHSAVAN